MALPYIVVIGGSYVGVKTAQVLAEAFHQRFRVLLIEKNSHFQHLFAFPRFAVTTKNIDIRKAFIPYTPGTFAASPPGSGSVVQARVTHLSKEAVHLDRNVSLDGSSGQQVPYEFLVIATGTKLVPPGSLPGSEKLDGVEYLTKHAQQIEQSDKIVVIGGGAVGVQMATDIKEVYPQKSVTLVHSRQKVMNRFHEGLHKIIAERAKELGIELELGSRVKVPEGGFPTDGSTFDVELESGKKIPANFAIVCTGQVPQSALVEELSKQSIDASGFIKIKKTMQIADDALPNVFVVGDIAHSGAPKAARPGMVQAEIVASNIQNMLDDKPLYDYAFDPAGIHLTLGIEKNVIFRDPKEGEEPMIKMQDNGKLDMGIDDVWKRRGGPADAFHL